MSMAGRLVLLAISISFGNALVPSPVSLAKSQVTPAPSYNLALALRQGTGATDCDGQGIFTCPIGTCYTGFNSYIGCCTAASCAVRTTCLPYSLGGASASCDMQTGGCVVCSEQSLPSCMTISNQANGQFIMYCGTSTDVTLIATSYDNLVSSGSTGQLPGSSTNILAGTAAPNAPSKSSGASGGEVGGIVVGAFVLIAAAMAGVFFYLRKRRSDRIYPHAQFSPLENKPSPFADMAVLGRVSRPRAETSFDSNDTNNEVTGLGILEDRGTALGASRNVSTRVSPENTNQFRVVNASPDPSSVAPSYRSSPHMDSALLDSGSAGTGVYSELDSTPKPSAPVPTATGWQGYQWRNPEAALADGYKENALYQRLEVHEMSADENSCTHSARNEPAELG